MSKQIAVRLPDDIVEFLDDQVAGGKAKSRAVVVGRALERERRREAAARDAAILARTGDDPDMDRLAEHVAGSPIDLAQVRPIHVAELDKARTVLILTRELVRPHMARVTVAPITTTARGLSTEVAVGPANGLEVGSVVSCDNVVTIPTAALGRQIGVFLPAQEGELAEAIRSAFDLD